MSGRREVKSRSSARAQQDVEIAPEPGPFDDLLQADGNYRCSMCNYSYLKNPGLCSQHNPVNKCAAFCQDGTACRARRVNGMLFCKTHRNLSDGVARANNHPVKEKYEPYKQDEASPLALYRRRKKKEEDLLKKKNDRQRKKLVKAEMFRRTKWMESHRLLVNFEPPLVRGLLLAEDRFYRIQKQRLENLLDNFRMRCASYEKELKQISDASKKRQIVRYMQEISADIKVLETKLNNYDRRIMNQRNRRRGADPAWRLRDRINQNNALKSIPDMRFGFHTDFARCQKPSVEQMTRPSNETQHVGSDTDEEMWSDDENYRDEEMM
jgi:hypothetical protein